MRIAIIGLGEVGRSFARALANSALDIVGACETFLSPTANELIDELKLVAHPQSGRWLEQADLVICAVTGNAALAAARGALPFMRHGAIYADFTTASPAEIRVAADEARQAGIRFVDVAIMGGVTLSGAKTPLLCAGNGAQEVARTLSVLNSNIRVIEDGQPGDAVTLKLLRSIFMKGLEALTVETLTLAESAGLKKKLYENLADFNEADLPTFLDMLARTHVLHAERRFHEVESAEAELTTAGFEPRVTIGVKSLFDRSRKAFADLHLPPDISVACPPSAPMRQIWHLE
mgnify:FL=1|nr:NAD(P)-binding domain-containing protein [uncultured Acidocella sp.]